MSLQDYGPGQRLHDRKDIHRAMFQNTFYKCSDKGHKNMSVGRQGSRFDEIDLDYSNLPGRRTGIFRLVRRGQGHILKSRETKKKGRVKTVEFHFKHNPK